MCYKTILFYSFLYYFILKERKMKKQVKEYIKKKKLFARERNTCSNRLNFLRVKD